MVIYTGDGKNIQTRIKNNHCSGNIESSALRKHVAGALGYKIAERKRPSGSIKIRIDMPNPRIGETNVSEFIRSGYWKYVICNSAEEARDFQWYAIEQLQPLLNKKCLQWNKNNFLRYQELYEELINTPDLPYEFARKIKAQPGVYVLYHHYAPKP